MKVCRKCEYEKDESEFRKGMKTKDGYAYVCKECKRYRKREYRERLGEYSVTVKKNRIQKENIDYRKFCKDHYYDISIKKCKKCEREMEGHLLYRIGHTIYKFCYRCHDYFSASVRYAEFFINRSLDSGIIFKPDSCSRCGEEKELRFYHKDLERIYDIIWLCKECEAGWHKSFTDKVLKNCTI